MALSSVKRSAIARSREVFGNRQSGLPEFAAADLVADAHILEVAQVEATQIWQKHQWQILPEYQALADYLAAEKRDNQFLIKEYGILTWKNEGSGVCHENCRRCHGWR